MYGLQGVIGVAEGTGSHLKELIRLYKCLDLQEVQLLLKLGSILGFPPPSLDPELVKLHCFR